MKATAFDPWTTLDGTYWHRAESKFYREVLRNLDHKARLLFRVLVEFADNENRQNPRSSWLRGIFPSIKTLAEVCGLSPASIKRALKALQAAGLVKKIHRGWNRATRRWQTNVYEVIRPCMASYYMEYGIRLSMGHGEPQPRKRFAKKDPIHSNGSNRKTYVHQKGSDFSEPGKQNNSHSNASPLPPNPPVPTDTQKPGNTKNTTPASEEIPSKTEQPRPVATASPTVEVVGCEQPVESPVVTDVDRAEASTLERNPSSGKTPVRAESKKPASNTTTHRPENTVRKNFHIDRNHAAIPQIPVYFKDTVENSPVGIGDIMGTILGNLQVDKVSETSTSRPPEPETPDSRGSEKTPLEKSQNEPAHPTGPSSEDAVPNEVNEQDKTVAAYLEQEVPGIDIPQALKEIQRHFWTFEEVRLLVEEKKRDPSVKNLAAVIAARLKEGRRLAFWETQHRYKQEALRREAQAFKRRSVEKQHKIAWARNRLGAYLPDGRRIHSIDEAGILLAEGGIIPWEQVPTVK